MEKFPSVRDSYSVTKGEVLALEIAKQAGIYAAQARIVVSGDFPVAIIKRFDRDLPFPDKKRALKTWICESTGEDASIESLMHATPYFGITLNRACELLAPIEAAVSRWRHIGQSLGMTNKELDDFDTAFEHEERLSARHILGLHRQ